MVDDGSCSIGGCTDSRLTGYASSATFDDGTCPLVRSGCVVAAATNFRPTANVDDGSCAFAGCLDSSRGDYDATATLPGLCTQLIQGCADSLASNYDAAVTAHVSSECVVLGCTNAQSRGYNPNATDDDGSCPPDFAGCTDSAATNYAPQYTIDNGACQLGGCLDPADPNFSPKVTYGIPNACANSRRRRKARRAQGADDDAPVPSLEGNDDAPAPSASPSPPPSASPSPPAPPLSALTEASYVSTDMSSTANAEKPVSWATDGVLDEWFKTEEAKNNWVSVRVAAGQYVGYVAAYNWLASAANRALLGDFEIWVGRAAGDTNMTNGAVKCGDSSYDASKPEEEPYVLWCGYASSGWSDSDGGEYITLKQTGDKRELRITELKVYAIPASPSPPPSVSPSPPPSASPAPPAPPLSALTEASYVSTDMSSTGDAEKPASWATDGVLGAWFKTKEAKNNWVSVRVAAGQYVGYVAAYNSMATAENRARLGDYEVWVGRAAGDTNMTNGAVKCGESSYQASKPEEEPYVMWCGEASSGWSGSDGGEYVTLKQTGDKRELRLTELKVYEAPLEGNVTARDPAGCLDPGATNFDPGATIEGPCGYDVRGCMDSEALNYLLEATVNNAADPCTYPLVGCMVHTALNYQKNATVPAAPFSPESCVLPKHGCTDSRAVNYRSEYNVDSIVSCTDFGCACAYEGCMISTAVNFDSNAAVAGPCVARVVGCQDSAALNYEAEATAPDTCVPVVRGCMTPVATNFNSTANTDDDSCIGVPYPSPPPSSPPPLAPPTSPSPATPPPLGCTDSRFPNYRPFAVQEDGSCIVRGCTDSRFAQYDPSATYDDGSCPLARPGCSDSSAVNFRPLANMQARAAPPPPAVCEPTCCVLS